MTEELSELDLLKQRAAKMGIKFHPNIGLETLQSKINKKLSPTEVEADDEPSTSEDIQISVTKTDPKKETQEQYRSRVKKECLKLIRIRITCMNPNKKDFSGEFFTVSNDVVGTLKKYVPFDNDEGWHVPQMILYMIQERKCQVFTTVTNSRGQKTRKGKLVNEFAVEILPPLTKEEIADLAKKQALGQHID